jgi:hypothetical protein
MGGGGATTLSYISNFLKYKMKLKDDNSPGKYLQCIKE